MYIWTCEYLKSCVGQYMYCVYDYYFSYVERYLRVLVIKFLSLGGWFVKAQWRVVAEFHT